MNQAKRWRTEAVGRLRDALASTPEAQQAFGNWYARRVWDSIARRVMARPFAFDGVADVHAILEDLRRRWRVRHEALCEAVDLDLTRRALLASYAIDYAFDYACRQMSMQPLSTADLGTLD